MKQTQRERLGASAGFATVAVGIAGMAFERGAPPATAGSERFIAFIRAYQGELLAQSLLLILGCCLSLWFYGALRSFLKRAEGETDTLSTLAFGAGCVNVGLQLTFQGVQIAMAMAVDAEAQAAAVLAVLGYALSVVAYAPFALMAAAVAFLSFGRKAFPRWLGVLSALTAAVNGLMLFGIVAKDGILTPGGALTYAAYSLYPLWFVATAASMFRRIGKQE